MADMVCAQFFPAKYDIASLSVNIVRKGVVVHTPLVLPLLNREIYGAKRSIMGF